MSLACAPRPAGLGRAVSVGRALRTFGLGRAVSVGLALLAAAACAPSEGGDLPHARVTIEGQALDVEVARTPAARQQGLSGREGLAPGTGLLFLHPTTELHRYWMKDMRFPIDIVWMRAGRIVDVSHRVPPPGPGEDGREIVVAPRTPCDAVLELPAGYARAHGFDVGQRVAIELRDEAAATSESPSSPRGSIAV
ncbi:MAG TPA: DUF192 domain-containing protein [Myxococcota bacterium]|nr:DUF192 domain-containing protein [Myxococcota bacterium]